jgi:hypothetical protein
MGLSSDDLSAFDPIFKVVRDKVSDEPTRRAIYRAVLTAMLTAGADREDLAYTWEPGMDLSVERALEELGLTVPDDLGDWAL